MFVRLAVPVVFKLFAPRVTGCPKVIDPDVAFLLIASQVNVAALTDVAVVVPRVQVPDADRAPVVDREEALVVPKVDVPADRAPVVDREEAEVAPRVDVPADRAPVVDRELSPKETG